MHVWKLQVALCYVRHPIILYDLMGSIATCSHKELLLFPASDLINYKNTQLHHVVWGRVREVQRKLSKRLDIRFGARSATVW